MVSDLEVFCRQVRQRSAEHRRAIQQLADADAPSQLMAILRQELDSMVRVIYLLAQNDHGYRGQLIAGAVRGKRWRESGRNGRVTDRDMVGMAQELHGWAESVYQFGCSFIHLSHLHDHRDRDAFLALDPNERRQIVSYLRHYHGGPSADEPALADILPLLPAVFEKIADNLECCVRMLEAGKDLED